jgi:hypothetical protein
VQRRLILPALGIDAAGVLLGIDIARTFSALSPNTVIGVPVADAVPCRGIGRALLGERIVALLCRGLCLLGQRQ